MGGWVGGCTRFTIQRKAAWTPHLQLRPPGSLNPGQNTPLAACSVCCHNGDPAVVSTQNQAQKCAQDAPQLTLKEQKTVLHERTFKSTG